jgi:SulP family sulfate permease
MATIIAILLTDLLVGITIGMMFGIFYTLKHSYRNSHHLKTSLNATDGKQVYHMELAEEVSFFNKASVLQALEEIPENSTVIIDCTKSKSIAHDVIELIVNYRTNAKTKNIQVETVNFIEP